MTQSHVVSGLVAKRAELTGKIENLQNELRQLVIALDHVEATLRVFDPDIDFESITPRRVPTAHHALRGEVSRIVLETLRTANRPISTTSLTDEVMRQRGLDVKDARLHRLIQARVGACCNHWKRVRGVLKSIPGPGGVLLWEVVPDRPLLAGK
jgi:hypothetical protein